MEEHISPESVRLPKWLRHGRPLQLLSLDAPPLVLSLR